MRCKLASIFGLVCLLGCGSEPKRSDDGDSRANEEGNQADPIDAGTRADGGKVDPTACIADAGEEHQADASAAHVSRFRDSELKYDDPPPTGGTHSECWADLGVYDTELEDARWVHNLEHGAIVLLHNCDPACPDEVEKLKAFVGSHPRTIVTPYKALPTRFAAVAWEYRLLNNCLDVPAVQEFYDAHFNRGREDIAGGPPDLCK